jgi:hypothetical protein
MTIEAARFMKLVILTKGYEKFDKAHGTMAVEFQSFCVHVVVFSFLRVSNNRGVSMHVSALCLEISNIYSVLSACFNSIDRNTSNKDTLLFSF